VTILKSLSIAGIASLPLAALTAAAFYASGERQTMPGDVPPVPASVAAVREKAAAALQGKEAAEAAAGMDPAGFRATIDDAAGKEPQYATAALLAEADAAAKADDLDRTTRALTTLADEAIVPVGLRTDVAKRRQQLERHATWLRNRTVASDALRLADETLRATPSIPNATKAAEALDDLRRRLPQVANEGTAADEPGDALTAREAAEASRLKRWADYRVAFLSLKAKHAALEQSKPDSLRGLTEGWDRFLAAYDRPGVPDPDTCVPEAKRLRTETRLAFLWATAVAHSSPEKIAPAVLAWLDEPRPDGRGDAGDADRRGQAVTLMKTWLQRHVPSPPQTPAGVAERQEGIIDAGETSKRLIAIFQAFPGQPRRYKWWDSVAERKNLPLGKDSGFLREPPTPPKCIGWAKRYREIRDTYLDGFMADDGSFATECRGLAEACRAHMQLPALYPDNDITAPVADWSELFSAAADRASAFQRACSDSGLNLRIRTRSP
jgi:hypothetical protein